MKFNATPISYRSTGLFSALINDYIENKGIAQSFVNYAATKEGYKKAIEQRVLFTSNRKVLVEVLQNQYTKLVKEDHVTIVQNSNNNNIQNTLLNAPNNEEAFK